MIKVIEHGYRKYHTTCPDCKCYFEYEISDVNSKNIVQCPDCKGGCYHNATLNADFTSKFEDNVETKGRIMEFSEGTPYLTNKEWLLTLDDEVLADLILDGLQRFARMSTSSIHYLTEWLGKEHTKDDYVEKYYIVEPKE